MMDGIPDWCRALVVFWAMVVGAVAVGWLLREAGLISDDGDRGGGG